jgi:LuxR family transcriptional regulator, maltose regulon positive regulatory protein
VIAGVTFVQRARLHAALDCAVDRPLTLIVGPPGAGKTALLESGVAAGRAPGPVTWLAPGEPLAGAGPGVLVLDDFHAAPPALQAELRLLLRHPDPALRVIVATRADPALPLARLRLQEQLAEIRPADLAFTPAETAALAGEDAERVWARTEGWVGAVCGKEHLLDEILASLVPDDRGFLLRTAVAGVLNGELADALTGGHGGQRRLAALTRAGVPLEPIDRRDEWYRYHPLFAALLCERLRGKHPREPAALHRRAARWHAERGDDAHAVRHAVDARAWELAARLAGERWPALLGRGEIGALAPLAAAIPPGRLAAHPELEVAFASLMLDRGDAAAAARHLRRAPAGASRTAVHLRVAMSRGRIAPALRAARAQDLDALEPPLRALALTNLGIAELWTGDIKAATRLLERGKAVADGTGSSRLALVALSYLAAAAGARDDFSRAGHLALQALALAEEHGWTATWPAAPAYLVDATVELLGGRLDAAEAALDRAGEALADAGEPPLHVVLALLRSGILGARGDLGAALVAVIDATEALGDWPLRACIRDQLAVREAILLTALGDPAQGERRLAEARSLPAAVELAYMRLADGEAEAARATLAPWLGALDGERAGPTVRFHVVDALALDALADHAGAAAALERALERAEPYGLRHALLAFGCPLEPLLRRQLARGTRHARLAADVATALAGAGRTAPDVETGGASLSARERAVLRYLPTTMSNQDIAAHMCVSVNTTKTHLKAIYRKLGVEDRRAAVARARALKLLSRSP